jgi:DNA-binding transcriptional LysR family regulator
MDENLELRHLRYFLAVAEELHFGRAAQRLHMAQPPLSQQIRRLEETIGHALFVRSSRSVKLTVAGEALRDRVKRTIAKVGEDLEVVRSVGRGELGSLNVAFVGSAMLTKLPRVLERYRKLYPRVQLRLREFHTAFLLESIREGTVDVGLVRDAGPVADIRVEKLLDERFMAVVPKTHPLAKLAKIPVKALKDEPFVLFSRSAGNYAWETTVKVCEAAGFRPNVVQEAPQWLTILRLVGAGLGVTIAPACVREIAAPDVVCRSLNAADVITNIELAYRTDQATPLAEPFCALARAIYLKS